MFLISFYYLKEIYIIYNKNPVFFRKKLKKKTDVILHFRLLTWILIKEL